MIKVNTTNWTRAVAEFIPHSRREVAAVLNNAAGNVAQLALIYTKRADAQKIQADLSRVKTDRYVWKKATAPRPITRGKRKGQMSNGKEAHWKHVIKHEPLTLAMKIIWKRGFRGTRADAARKALAMINARKRSIGFIASGWIPAIQRLKRKMIRSFDGAFLAGQPKGTATLAYPGKLTAIITNDTQVASLIGADALQRAVDEEALAFREHLRARLQQKMERETKTASSNQTFGRAGS